MSCWATHTYRPGSKIGSRYSFYPTCSGIKACGVGWDTWGEGTTLSATKQEPKTLVREGVQTLWILVLACAEIQKDLHGLRGAWSCTLVGRRERGGWCLAQQTSVLLFCGQVKLWFPLWAFGTTDCCALPVLSVLLSQKGGNFSFLCLSLVPKPSCLLHSKEPVKIIYHEGQWDFEQAIEI